MSLQVKKLIAAAFPPTVPVLTGYVFMGAAFGVLLTTGGFHPLWAPVMALVIYAGSGQFVAVGLLAAGFDPLGMFLVILMVNARHVFYGLSTLERFRDFGRYRGYLVFALTDETFALFNSVEVPDGMDERKFLTMIAALDHCYWIVGCTLGGFAGVLLTFDPTGIEFVMTALFVVILIQQFERRPDRAPALIGLGVSVLCRLAFGSQAFIISAMVALLAVFALARPKLERRWGV
jgi:4-azaleucine resistance transporter AzlC